MNGHVGISPNIASKISEYLGTPTQMWLNGQFNYDCSKIQFKKSKDLE